MKKRLYFLRKYSIKHLFYILLCLMKNLFKKINKLNSQKKTPKKLNKMGKTALASKDKFKTQKNPIKLHQSQPYSVISNSKHSHFQTDCCDSYAI